MDTFHDRHTALACNAAPLNNVSEQLAERRQGTSVRPGYITDKARDNATQRVPLGRPISMAAALTMWAGAGDLGSGKTSLNLHADGLR